MRLTRVIYKPKMKKTDQACFELFESTILRFSLCGCHKAEANLFARCPSTAQHHVRSQGSSRTLIWYEGTKEMESNNQKKRKRLNHKKTKFTLSLCDHQI